MKKIRCPYCGKKVGYFEAFFERKRGEHTCSHCGRNSTVFFSISFKIAICLAILLSVILVVISINPYFVGGLWGMLWVAVPFLVLYLITPFFLKLVPIKRRSSLDIESIESSDEAVSDNQSTKMIDKLDGSFKSGESDLFSKIDDDNELLDISDLEL